MGYHGDAPHEGTLERKQFYAKNNFTKTYLLAPAWQHRLQSQKNIICSTSVTHCSTFLIDAHQNKIISFNS